MLLVLDAGTGGGRAVIYDTAGRRLAAAYREWGYLRPADGGPLALEFDPDQFWAILGECIQEALARAGGHAERVLAVSATSQREGIVLVDGMGREVYAGPNLDRRAQEEGEALAQQWGEEIYRSSGHWPTAMFAPARLWWLRSRRPHVYGEARHLLLMNDWILYRLSGRMVSEPTNGAETLCLDVKDRCWNYSLVEKLGLDAALLCPLVAPGTAVGEVTEAAAADTGLEVGTPVVAGAADTQAALLGAGVLEAGEAGIVSGSSTPVQLVVDEYVLDPQHRTWTSCHAVPGRWVVEGNAGGTGSVHRWLRDALEYGSYDEMERAAESVPPGCGGMRCFLGPRVIYRPGVLEVPGSILGVGPDWVGDGCLRLYLARGVLENVAFAVRANLDLVEAVAGRRATRLVLTGGGSRSRLLCQLVADVCGRPVTVPEDPETTSRGAAMCAGVGVGLFWSLEEAARRWPAGGRKIEPSARASEYADYYRDWYRKFTGLADLFQEVG